MSPDALDALRAYQQANEDGSLVTVSRQALDEGIAALEDLYALGLMTEEFGEVLQLIGKWLRFGPDHARRDGHTARSLMPVEMGDAAAAMDFAILDGIARFGAVIDSRERKKARLLNPASRNDQGERLAPEPRGHRRSGQRAWHIAPKPPEPPIDERPYTGPIEPGMGFLWEPGAARATRQTAVVIEFLPDGKDDRQARVRIDGPAEKGGAAWFDESRFREAVVRCPALDQAV